MVLYLCGGSAELPHKRLHIDNTRKYGGLLLKVEIINPEVLENLYKNHGVFACTCYDTPSKYAEKVGRACEKDGHMSGSRCEYIKFRITDVDRGTAEQCMRHEIGVSFPFEDMDNYTFDEYSEKVIDVSPDQIVKNMGSFRYIDKSGFTYTTPIEIWNNIYASKIYKDIMGHIEEVRKDIKALLVEDGVDEKRANECANFVLPRATNSTLTIGFTPEALLQFMHKRLCSRAQPEIKKLAIMIKKAIKEVNPEFEKELVPHCVHLMWCPEGKKMTCGAYPTKNEVEEILKNAEKIY